MDPLIARSKWGATTFSPGIEMKIKYLHVFGIHDNGTLGALLVTLDDNVYGVGYNGDWGLLGVPHRTEVVEPEVLVYRLSHQRVSCISVGETVGAATTRDGRIFHWGRDLRAEVPFGDEDDAEVLGVEQPDGSGVHHFVQVACGSTFVAALTDQLTVILWGSITEGADVLHGHTFPTSQIISLSCGMQHIAMLSTSGDVYTCGYGRDGQLGRKWNGRERYLKARPVPLDHPCTRVIQVACGCRSTLFLMEDGSLLATGTSDDEDGHIGVQTQDVDQDGVVPFPERVVINQPVERIAATNSSPSIYAAVTQYGNVFTWGEYQFPRKLRGETELVSAFYGAAIPSHLGDVFWPRDEVPPAPHSQNAAARRPNAQNGTRPGQPSSNTPKECEQKSHEFGSIMSDLTALHDEVGNLIQKLAPLLECEKTSNSRTSTNKKYR